MQEKIKKRIGFGLSVLLVTIMTLACSSDYQGKRIASPSEEFFVQANVNRSSKDHANYGLVVLELTDKDGQILDKQTSRVGDFNKWELGWSETGDTIVLQSTDIGTQRYTVSLEKKLLLVEN